MDMDIKIIKTDTPKAMPQSASELGFGKIFTDHMFIMEYEEGKGWMNPRVQPYQPFQMDPSALVLHYGQTIFEGMKAYNLGNGEIGLFRPADNFKRMNNSAQRLCIPQVDVDFAIKALKTLIDVERAWVPEWEGTSLYIRPVTIATDARLGVHAGAKYTFYIVLCPVAAYYAAGLAPVKIFVEDEYVRAVRGGLGFAKTAANYAASLFAGEIAEKKGFSQVLWLDGIDRKYIEEVGAMNIFFRFEDELTTPQLQGSILPGITRDSIIKLAGSMGYPVNERRIAMQEVHDRCKDGSLVEVFGSGTAAVVSPVGSMTWEGEELLVGDGGMGKLSLELYDKLTKIQKQQVPDPFGWTMKL